MKDLQLADNRRCFACGPENPIGLHLDFTTTDGRTVCRFTPHPDHQGYAGITHGGILATVLDEAMARVLWDQGQPVLTGSFEVRLRRPVKDGQELLVEAWVESRRGRFIQCQAVITNSEGQTVAQSTGTYVQISEAD